MALITCPECKKKISDNANSCPHCGYQLTPEKLAEIKKEDQRKYKSRNIGFLALILILVILYIIGHFLPDSQKNNKAEISSAKKAKGNSQESKPSHAYLKTTFDKNTERIPVSFLGHDIEQIYNAFDRRKKAEQKDEFETKEQYQRRLAAQAEKPLFGSVGPDAVFAFVASPTSQYDADSQILTVTIETSNVWKSAEINGSRLGLFIKRGEVITKESTRQNAYGAKVEIKETDSTHFELAIHNHLTFKTEKVLGEDHTGGETVFVGRINLSPAKAKAIKNNLAALILTKLTTPNISDGAIYIEPTFDFHYEYFTKMCYVNVNLLEIWIYDKLTGEVIIKIKGK